MATQQIVDNFILNGGYIDAGMSVNTIADLQSLSRNTLFNGRSVTVLSAIVTESGKSIPADFWLSEGKSKSYWKLKTIAPIDEIEQMSNIPSEFISNGFKVLTKSGESFIFDGVDENGERLWTPQLTRKEFDETIDSAVKMAIDEVTSGASSAFDTLQEVEEWINNHEDIAISVEVEKDIENLKESAHTHNNKEILDNISKEKTDEWDNAKHASGTLLDEEIKVTTDAGNYKKGMVIQDGTSLMEVLKNFLSKTTYPNAATKPSIELVIGDALNYAYEVGSIVSIPEISVKTKKGSFNYTDYSGVEAQGGDFREVLVKTDLISGFENYNDTKELVSSPILAQDGVVINEGENKIVINVKAIYNAPSNLPTNSDGEETTQTGSTSSDNLATWTEGEINMAAHIHVIGYHNIFYGTTNEKTELSSDFIRTLNRADRPIGENDSLDIQTIDSENHNRFIIAVPSNKTLKLVEDSTSTQDLTKLLLITQKNVEVFSEDGSTSTIYNVYDKSWAGSFGNEIWKIKVKDLTNI